MSNTKKRIRISDVARRAEVSAATVSAVVSNQVGEKIRVSPETQARVWQAVRDLGYIPNPVAQSLAGGKNHIIGLFTYEPIFPIEYRNFYYRFLIGIEEEAEAQGYDLLLFSSARQSTGKRSVYQDGVSRLGVTDGAILLGRGEDKAELEMLLGEGFPFVYVGRRDLNHPHLSYVAADYESATATIVQHIAGFGHSRIAYIGSGDQREATRDRESGYSLGLEAAGLPDAESIFRLAAEDLTPDQFAAFLEQGYTAFIAEDDTFGTALLKAAGRIGLQTPGDFSLAVLGNPLSEWEDLPDWTMFTIPRRQMGMMAVRMLISMLKNPESSDPQRITLPCDFVPGRTVGLVSNRKSGWKGG